MDELEFGSVIAQARAGDESAIRRLLESFEAEVRMMVRVRLPRALRAQFDSMDFVQSVWQSVFSDVDHPAFAFDHPRHFGGYLAGIVKNKVFEQYRRRTHTRKYDLRREEPLYVRRGGRDELREVAATDPTPSQEAQAGDCWDRMVAGRSPRESEIMALRRQGLTFDEIADRVGLSERGVRRVIESVRKCLEDQP